MVERGDIKGTSKRKEAKSVYRKTIPVARRVLGEGHRLTLKMRWQYAMALYKDDGATLDDLREAVTTLEDTVRLARRLFGSAHPLTEGVEKSLRLSRARLDGGASRAVPAPAPAPAHVSAAEAPAPGDAQPTGARKFDSGNFSFNSPAAPPPPPAMRRRAARRDTACQLS